MNLAVTILAILIALLSIAAGGAKIALVPDEVAFLGQFGFTNPLTVLFGVVQVVAGLLLFLPRTRLHGAVAAGVAFAASAALLVVAGSGMMAGVSVLPVVLAAAVAFGAARLRAAE